MEANLSPRTAVHADAGGALLFCWIARRGKDHERAGAQAVSGAMAGKAFDIGKEGTIEEVNALLVAVAKNQDRAAFRRLFAHFAPRLKAFMMRHGSDEGLAEEIVQETLINVWRKAPLFDPTKAAASTWIFTIARNLRIDLLRKAHRPEPDMNDPALVPDPEPASDDVLSLEQDVVRLKQVVDLLPAEQQEVLRLAFFEEKAHGKVAEELGVPLGTVKSRIRLALKRIRSELGADQ